MEEYALKQLYDYFSPLRESLSNLRSLNNYRQLIREIPQFIDSLNKAFKNNLVNNGFFEVFGEDVKPLYEKRIFNALDEAINLWSEESTNNISIVKNYIASEWRELNKEFNDYRGQLKELLDLSSGLKLIELLDETKQKLINKRNERLANIKDNAIKLLMKGFNKGLYGYCNKVALILEPYLINLNQEITQATPVNNKSTINELKLMSDLDSLDDYLNKKSLLSNILDNQSIRNDSKIKLLNYLTSFLLEQSRKPEYSSRSEEIISERHDLYMMELLLVQKEININGKTNELLRKFNFLINSLNHYL